MKVHEEETKICPFAFLPHLTAHENLARMVTKYEELSRNAKKLSRMQKRLKDLYGTLVLLLSHLDWDQPYTVDLERIYAECQKHGRYSEDVSPTQERDISVIPYLVITSEAWRMHEKAVAARDWANVDYTLRQYADIQRDYNFHVFARTEQRMAQLKKYRQSGKKGGHRSHDWERICCHYDTLMAAGKQRADVTTILRHTYEIRGDDLNRGLRAQGRGKRTKVTFPTRDFGEHARIVPAHTSG